MSLAKRLISTEAPFTLEAFNIVSWTGDGASSRSFTGLGFQPDLIWVKARAYAWSHALTDSNRGVDAILGSQASSTESTYSASWRSTYGQISSFDSDGFTVSRGTSTTGSNYNTSGVQYIAWCWRMNGGSTTTTSGVARQVNSTYGQAIMTYAGNSTGNRYIDHQIGTAPRTVITKARDFNAGWPTQIDLYYGNRLNQNAANNSGNGNVFYTNWPPSTTQYRIGSIDEVNWSGYNYVAYAFASITGYSKMGSWVGNGTNRTITTGFQPDWIMIKTMSTTGDWQIWDSVRGFSKKILANSDVAETTTSVITGVSSTGFSITSDSTVNGSGTEYAYLAFKIT